MTFCVGQQVVCIRGPFWRGYHDETQPTVGLTYTIRSIRIFPDGLAGLTLEEVRNSVRLYYEGGRFFNAEAHFDERRFRPIVTRKTDIGFAHEILRKRSIKVAEPA